jgi:uncharacterized membrane protein YgdD (TMEM256/DUF423 family)
MQSNASSKWLLIFGSINMFLAVALGAFGAHALKASLPPDLMAVYHTGNQYHFYHALGLFAVALVAWLRPGSRLIGWSAVLMGAGILLFSGSLYVLSLTGLRSIGVITPFGGTAFLVAWSLLALAAWEGKGSR